MIYHTRLLPIGKGVKTGQYYKLGDIMILKRSLLSTDDDPDERAYYKEKEGLAMYLVCTDLTPKDLLSAGEQVHIPFDGSEQPFKVVAKVSGFALSFVKRGQTYEQDQVRFKDRAYDNPYSSKVDDHSGSPYIDIAMIQCPNCTHFH